jgi:nucleoside-diphosphate-sugar epimerase
MHATLFAMNIVVTGGSGRIGRYVVRYLHDRGHAVLNIDVKPFSAAEYLRVDLRNAGEVYSALATARPDVVVHLAAWAGDGFVPPLSTYHHNTGVTYSVLQAACDLGVKRVIVASSHHVYGNALYPPVYLPLDEDHPIRPVGPYGLSKLAGEHAAEYFTRVHGMEVLSFRYVGVRTPEEMDAAIAQVSQHPDRNLRLMWTRMDARDAAGYCGAAAEAEKVEPGPYNISSRYILLDEESKTLVRRHFRKETEIREGLEGNASPISTAKARAAFDYTPQFEWSVHKRHPE